MVAAPTDSLPTANAIFLFVCTAVVHPIRRQHDTKITVPETVEWSAERDQQQGKVLHTLSTR